jgi:heme exporter protein B
MLHIVWIIIIRDLKVYRRRSGETWLALVFFFMIASLFPMVLQQPSVVLSEFAPAIIWVAALLASMLSYESLYRLESEEDSILQLLLSPFPLPLLLFGKVLAHWLWTGFPLSIIAVLLGMMFGLSLSGILSLLSTLTLGTLILSFIAGIGVGLTHRAA